MKTKIIGIFVLTLLTTSGIPTIGIFLNQTDSAIGDITDSAMNKIQDGGWYEVVNGINILHTNGSYYEMGYQHGYLLSDMIEQNRRAILGQYTQVMPYEEILNLYYEFEEFIPQNIKDEMQGLADGSGLPFEDFAASVALDLIAHDMTACISGAAWDSATIDGKLYHFRSHDWTLQVQDPETGTYLQDNLILFVRKPNNGYASITVNYAGSVGNPGGFNEEGITVGSTLSWCMNDISNKGIPSGIRIKLTLDQASNMSDAVSILNSIKTRGNNYVISDSEIMTGSVVEVSAAHSYVGTWDDPVESNRPYYSIENVVRRGNLYIDKTMANLQRLRYNPTSFVRFMLTQTVAKLLGIYDSYKYEYFAESEHYQVLSRQLKNKWGTLDLETIMEMLRSIYRNDLHNYIFNQRFLFVKKILPNRCYNVDNYQWVVCPETGEFLISFAKGETRAHDNAVHSFNMVDLFNTSPP